MTRVCPLRPLILVLILAASPLAAAPAGWIGESNAHAGWLLGQQAKLNPEAIGQAGFDGVDEEIIDLGPDLTARTIAANEDIVRELTRRRVEAEDPRVRQDLDVMLASVERDIQAARLNYKLTIPYFSVPHSMYFGLSALLDPQIPAERQAAALVRLRRYAGAEPGYEPTTERARALMESRFDVEGLIWPYRGQVERDLENADRFMAGIRQLFEAMALEGYEENLAALDEQVAAHDAWVREQILPRAREDFRLPPALYALSLEQFGVDASPDELIADATAAFAEIRNEMAAIARLVAAGKGWEETDYRTVIRRLKQDRFEDGNILSAYHATNEALEEIIRREDIVSLPPREVAIRMKTPAEEAAVPVPSLQPPRLVGNTGEVVEFLLPSAGSGETEADDFIFEATV